MYVIVQCSHKLSLFELILIVNLPTSHELVSQPAPARFLRTYDTAPSGGSQGLPSPEHPQSWRTLCRTFRLKHVEYNVRKRKSRGTVLLIMYLVVKNFFEMLAGGTAIELESTAELSVLRYRRVVLQLGADFNIEESSV